MRTNAAAWRPRPLVRASIWLHAALLPTVAAFPAEGLGWAAGTVLANHAVLAAASLWPHSQWAGHTLVRLPPEQARQGLVALTFDDGPDPEVTPRVLDMLDAHGAKASFFCVGRRAAAYPDLVAEIARRGHAVENHTWSHSHGFALLGPRAMAREIQRGQALLGRLTGARPRWLRAPAGMRSPVLDPVLARTGIAHASWTRRGFDTACGDPARVLARLTRGLQAGDILLLHDHGCGRTAGGAPVVMAVLPPLLEAIAAAGLRAVPLPPPAAMPAAAAAARSRPSAAHAST